MTNQYATLVIFSVYRSQLNETDNIQSTELIKDWMRINDIDYQVLNGVYKGIEETSFAVSAKHQRAIEIIARDFDQESILIRHNDLHSELKTLKDNKIVALGKWTEVPRHEALQTDAYTLERETDRYFVVKGA